MNFKNFYLNFVGRYSINIIVWLFAISLKCFDYYCKTQDPIRVFGIGIDYAQYCGSALFILFLVLIWIEQKFNLRIKTKWLLYNPFYIIPLLWGLFLALLFMFFGTYIFIDDNIL